MTRRVWLALAMILLPFIWQLIIWLIYK